MHRARSAAISAVCSHPSVVRRFRRAAAAAFDARDTSVAARLALAALRTTVFEGFSVFDKGLEGCKAVHAGRFPHARLAVDSSSEESADGAARDAAAAAKVALVGAAKRVLGEAVAMVAVKPTALVDPALLERMTTAIAGAGGDAARVPLGLGLEGDDPARLASSMERLRRVCAAASALRVSVLLDAEQTARQPAIDAIARALMAEFNVRGSAAPPALYVKEKKK